MWRIWIPGLVTVTFWITQSYRKKRKQLSCAFFDAFLLLATGNVNKYIQVFGSVKFYAVFHSIQIHLKCQSGKFMKKLLIKQLNIFCNLGDPVPALNRKKQTKGAYLSIFTKYRFCITRISMFNIIKELKKNIFCIMIEIWKEINVL